MAKRSHDMSSNPLESSAKKLKYIPYSDSTFLKTKVQIGDRSL